MEHAGVITPRDLKSIDGEIETLIDSCWKAALTEPYLMQVRFWTSFLSIGSRRTLNDHAANYGGAICSGFEYLLDTYPEGICYRSGGLEPWYVGNSMADLDKKFGKDRQ